MKITNRDGTWTCPDGQSLDLVSQVVNEDLGFKQSEVSCLKIRFRNLTDTKAMQLAWYLEENHAITYDQIEKTTEFLNFLENHDISYTFSFRKLKVRKNYLRVNFAIFNKWYLPLKMQWYKGKLRQAFWGSIKWLLETLHVI